METKEAKRFASKKIQPITRLDLNHFSDDWLFYQCHFIYNMFCV